MTCDDLDRRAELTIWGGNTPAHTALSQEFSTLRDALTAAANAISTDDARPWIVTEEGDLLSPNWIRAIVGLTHGHQAS
jgi:hypothetical protein